MPLTTRRTLIVDGDAGWVAAIARILVGAGHQVSTALDAEEASRTLRRGRHTLLIIGPSIAAETRSELLEAQYGATSADGARGGAIAVLHPHDAARPSEPLSALASGADDAIIWPASHAELLLRVGAVLRRKSPSAPMELFTYGAGLLQIDLAAHEIRVAGGAVRSTRGEFLLLRALAERAGRLCSHADLVTARGGGTASDVRKQMSRLRAKLGPAAAIIELVRGKGYRLRVAARGNP